MTDRERAQQKSNESTVAWDPKRVDSDERPMTKIKPRPQTIGIISGVVMSIYLFLINAAAEFPSYGAKIFKYFFLGGFLTWALVRLSRVTRPGIFVKRAVAHAAWISGLTAVLVAIANLIFHSINPDWGFEKFVNSDGSGLTAIAYSGIQFFEIFAIGMIIALILIQFLKGRTSENNV